MTAQSTTTTDPNERSQEFVPVTGGTETTSAELMLVLAYLVMWGLLLAFVGLGWRRQAKVEARIADLERAVGAGKARDP